LNLQFVCGGLVLKGIVLHGGAGTRLRPLTYSGPKQLIPVANKPVSQYALEDLRDCGVRNIAIILGETFPELVKEYYGDGSRFNVRITYIYQGKPLGIAHAVGLCKDFVGDSPFIVYLGDNILQYGIKAHLERFVSKDYDAMVLLKEVDDPTRFGVAKFDEEGRLVKLVEKPKEPPSRFALVGVYFLKPVIFDVIRDLKPSWRGELEITDALQMLIDRGFNVGYDLVRGWWFDTGKKDDILTVNAKILDERITECIKGILENSKVEGRVNIGEGTRIINSVVRGPSIIGEKCIIKDSYIGPYTSIGDNVSIIGSGVEYSVIMDNVSISGVDRLDECLVGRYSKIVRAEGNRRAVKLHIRDYSEIIL